MAGSDSVMVGAIASQPKPWYAGLSVQTLRDLHTVIANAHHKACRMHHFAPVDSEMSYDADALAREMYELFQDIDLVIR